MLYIVYQNPHSFKIFEQLIASRRFYYKQCIGIDKLNTHLQVFAH